MCAMSYNKIRQKIKKGQEGLVIDPISAEDIKIDTSNLEAVQYERQQDFNRKQAMREGIKNAAIQGATAIGGQLAADLGGEVSANSFSGAVKGIKNAIATGDAKAGIGAAVAGGVGMAIGALDKGFLENKNFGAQSQAVDSTVHGVSGALMQSGNSYAMAAGAILEGINFLDKAGGQTTPGYSVNIDNSGYSTDMTSMESKSSRTGFFNLMAGNPMQRRQRMQKQLEDRNNKVRMALDAAEISADQQFEQEARMNSISNTIMNNQEALAGGYSTTALGM